VINRRLTFFVMAVATLAGTLLTAQPAQAHRGCGDHGYGGRYRRSYRVSYHRGDYCRPRRPRRVVRYVDYDYAPRYSYRRSGYSCGDCHRGFGSNYWLTFHYRNSGCG
jgi:hypothetical protein